jgi:hypothetical protein
VSGERHPCLTSKGAATMFVVIWTLLALGCHREPPAAEPVPRLPAAPLSEPPLIAETSTPAASPVSVPEKLITLNGDWDVRLALEEIARTAGYSLVLSPKIAAKKVRLSLVNVPASEALKAVLDAGELSLAASTGIRVPMNPSVVFYQLPVNVDSMSVGGIMKRFGVSQEIAEMILKGRTP